MTMMRSRLVPLATPAIHRTSLAGLEEALPRWMEPATGVIGELIAM